ncbi:MAG: S8 family peptidase [Candidatus Eisenbacteria bacterium]|uniref:S8 family peptidase n=1 Tax=Eiseniibacteriota bacterium TaxID=2212470 RepID=A0A849SNA8_UNCEI|nr:S8 family peptidase [Candidatus Eisenbacteria bacterium]
MFLQSPSRLPHAIANRVLLTFLAVLVPTLSNCSRDSLTTAPRDRDAVLGDPANPPTVRPDPDALNEVIVTLANGVSAEQFAAEFGATLTESGNWGCARFVPQSGEPAVALADRMALDPRALTAEQNMIIETAESRQKSVSFDDGFGSPETYYGQAQTLPIGLSEAHQVTRGANVRVAILDTGAELNHPVLMSRIAGGWDFIDGDSDPSDTGDGLDNDLDGDTDEARGHGTHVAGIVSLVAPDAQLLVVRVLDADGRGDMMKVAQGIVWAKYRGARVINMSLGSLSNSKMVQWALNYANQEGKVVSVASAGNWGAPTPIEYPAQSTQVLAVAALDHCDQRAVFSSYGGFVDYSAPGVAVRSAFPGGGYALWSGTSMSAPFVAGAAALLISVHPGWNGAQVDERLAANARSIEAKNPGLHDLLGHGALDLGAALAADAASVGTGGGAHRIPNRAH